LNDQSLLLAELKGVLITRILNVVVSNTPVYSIEQSSGKNMLVWKYDYTLEYNDNQLSDPDYRVRRCDVAYNCCRGCSHVYTDRKVQGMVHTITGCGVNSDDPENIVLDVRECFSGEDTESIIYNYDNVTGQHSADVRISGDSGNITEIRPNGIYTPTPPPTPPNLSIVAGSGCFAPGANNMIRSLSAAGNALTISGAPEHFVDTPAIRSAGSPPLPINISSVGNYGAGFQASMNITNPSSCRSARVMYQIDANFFVFLHSGGSFGLQVWISEGAAPLTLQFAIPFNIGPTDIFNNSVVVTLPMRAMLLTPGEVRAVNWSFRVETLVGTVGTSTWLQLTGGMSAIVVTHS